LPIIIALLLALSLCTATARAALPGNWTAYDTLQDTAANAIDFTWKKECPTTADAECRLVWKFRNRYRQPVRLTWRVIYGTSQGKKVLQKEVTVSPGESPEYSAEGESLDTVQVGVSKSEVGTVGVTTLDSVHTEERIAPPDDMSDDPGTASGAARRAQHRTDRAQTEKREAELITETAAALKAQQEHLQHLLEQAKKYR
jgi:hypothetical protein